MIEMSKMKEMKTLGSVQYVHDPEAAQNGLIYISSA